MLTGMDLQAVTGPLYVVDGEVKTGTAVPGVLAQSAPAKAARGRERDFLFIHLSLGGHIEETAIVAHELLEIIGKQFYQSNGSVTASLRKAILAANERLLRQSLSQDGPSYEGAITCAILRQNELFVVQVGESLALLGHNFGIERLPNKKPDRITPLGRSAGLDFRYFHHRLQAGDMLLLADPRLTHLSTHLFEPVLVDTEVEHGLSALIRLVGNESGRLLLIEFADDVPMTLPTTPAPIIHHTQEAKTIPHTAVANANTVPMMRVPSSQQPTQPKRQVLPREPKPEATTKVDMEATARKATAQAAMGLSRLTAGLAAVLARLRPPQLQTNPPEEEVDWRLATIIALVIPILVVSVALGVYLQRGNVRQFAEIKTAMEQNLGLASQAPDESAARNYYNNVQALAIQAERYRKDDPDIARLRRDATNALDRLDGITRLQATPFYEYSETVDLTSVVLRDGFNGGIYTLDSTFGHVYEHQTDESYTTPLQPVPSQLVFREQAISTHVVGNVVDLVWRPRGTAVTREGLAMLDSNGALLSYFPNFSDIRPVPLGLASDWQQPTAITTFSERLYILDIGAGQIWKYFPDGDGFIFKEDERTILLNNSPDLAQAKDIAIYSEDGSLVIVYEDGRIRYYDTRSGRILWDELSLLQNGLSSPMLTPTAVKLVGPGLNASIFVADPGTSRIVQISRGGTVLAQYRASDENGREAFSQLSDFAVATTPLRIFVAGDNILYLATQ